MHSLSSRQVRKNQILGDWIERFHRNLRLGSKTLPQIHGFQILLRAATQGLGEISVCAIGLVLAILKVKKAIEVLLLGNVSSCFHQACDISF